MCVKKNTSAFSIVSRTHQYMICYSAVQTCAYTAREHRHDWYLGSRCKARPKIVCENRNIMQTTLQDYYYMWEMLPHPLILQTWVPAMKLKEPFRGHRFPTLNYLNLAMTWRIRELNSIGLLDGVKKFPNRWKCVIEARGDYTEQRRYVKIDLNE